MHDVVVTGIGMISSAGEGPEAHLSALAAASPRTDRETFAPFSVHPVTPPNYDTQIAKKSDQRQMEAWQKLGCYAAGLALDSAGVKEDAELKSRMHLIVAAGGGERDYAVDGQILTGLRGAGDTRAPLVITIVTTIGIRLFLAWLCGVALEGGLFGAWIGMCADMLMRGVLAAVRFAGSGWTRVRV